MRDQTPHTAADARPSRLRTGPADGGASEVLERVRYLSALAVEDANAIIAEGESALGEVRLDQLYVLREQEEEIRQMLQEGAAGRSIVVKGEAGYGKTSLLWSLHRWLRTREREAWFVKSGLLDPSPRSSPGSSVHLNASELLDAAAEYHHAQGRPPVILLDTVDLLLHDPASREATLLLLWRLLDLGCAMVLTSRPQELAALRSLPGQKKIRLREYRGKELTEAIRKHVGRFYERPDHRSIEEHVYRIRKAFAGRHSLFEVCVNPLTLRMLFVLYAPQEIHTLEVNVFQLYQQYWDQRIREDRRAGDSSLPLRSANLERTATAVALVMLAEGRPELGRRFLRNAVGRFGGEDGEIDLLVKRGLLRVSGREAVAPGPVTVSFFHQSFFEHGAAHGLLALLKDRRLPLGRVAERFLGHLEDLFLAPVFEQTLLLAEDEPFFRAQAAELQCELLAHPHPAAQISGVYVYAHREEPEPEVRAGVVEILERGDVTIGKEYLRFAPNISDLRWETLHGELDLLWRRGEWALQTHTFDVLDRLVARRPASVRELIVRWRVLDWLDGLAGLASHGQKKLLRLYKGLLPEDPSWVWTQLLELYRRSFRDGRVRDVHAAIVELLAANAELFGGAKLVLRLEAAVGDIEPSRSTRSLARTFGQLWTRLWREETHSCTGLYEEWAGLSGLRLAARLEGLAGLLTAANVETLRSALWGIEKLAPPARWEWVKTVPGRLLDRERSAAAGRNPLHEVLREAFEDVLVALPADGRNAENRSTISWLRPYLIEIARLALPYPEALCDFFRHEALRRPEPWVAKAQLRAFLVPGLLAGHPGARAAGERILKNPASFDDELLYGLSKRLTGDDQACVQLGEIALTLSLMRAEPFPLLSLLQTLNPPAPEYLSAASPRIDQLLRMLLASPRELDRREGFRMWNHGVRLGLVQPPPPEELEQQLARDPDPRVRAYVAKMLGETAIRSGYPLPRVIEILSSEPVARQGTNVREKAVEALFSAIVGSSDPGLYLDEAVRLATDPPVRPKHLFELGGVLIHLCQSSPHRVFEALDKVMDAPGVGAMTHEGRKKAASKFSAILRDIYRFGTIEDKRCLLGRVPGWAYAFQREIVSAACAVAFQELKPELDALYEDSRVPDRLKEFIHRAKYANERTEGGQRWQELYELGSTADQPGAEKKKDAVSAIDLEIRVRTEQIGSGWKLDYVLHSPSGAVDFHHYPISGPVLRADPESYRNLLIKKLEDLQRGFDLGKSPILQKDTPRKLEAVGHILYEELFTPELRAAYRDFHKKVETVLITSDEPWIPWELIKPYDDGVPDALIDDDFLCLQFQLTRWLSGTSVPAGAFRVGRVGCVEAGKTSKGPELKQAARECEILSELAARHGTEAKILPDATAAELEALIEEGVDLLHVASHGEFDAERPDESELILKGRHAFRPSDLHGRLRTRVRGDRPLVFFNTCQLGRQGWALTGLGGWAKRWVVDCRCGAFIGPQWAVKDSLAYTFARELYQQLGAGKTLGQAALAARKATWDEAQGRPTWSAFHVYGHPNASMQGHARAAGGDSLFDPPGAADEPPGRLPLPPSSFLGRDDDLRDVKERLLGHPEAGSRQGSLLLMTGWPGVGKTTMTTALANDPELRAGYPDGVLWTALDQSPSLLTELNSWCIALGSPGLSPQAGLDQASRHLSDLLRERKVLLLVDDVWESAHAVPLLVGGPGCAMLATSRLDAVAQELAPGPEAIYRLPLLSEDAALELLRSRAPRVVDAHPEKCRTLVAELEGLPLALHVAGRMLDEEDRLGWGVEELLEELREGTKLLAGTAPSDRTDLRSQTLPTVAVLLSKSTERLPEEVLERFAYLGVLAPKPATFALEAMQAIWHVDDPKPTVRRLVRRGLLEPVGGSRFRMHTLLVAHARSLLEE